MKEMDRYKPFVTALMSLSLLLLTSALFGYIWYRHYAYVNPSLRLSPLFFRRGNWLVIAVYAVMTLLLARVYGGYRIGHRRRGDAVYSTILSTVLVNVLTYFQISLIARRFAAIRPMLLLTLLDAGCIVLWAVIMDRTLTLFFPPRRILVVYGGRRTESLILKMSRRPEKYRICEAVHIREGLDAVFARIQDYGSVLISDVPSPERSELLKFCFRHSVRTYLTPKISDTIVRGADPIHLFDTPLLLCRSTGLRPGQRFLKRTMDLTFSLLALIPAAPLMLGIAAAVRLGDGGPIFYRQERLTLDGRHFSLYKFRSMVVDAEKQGGPRLASEGDRRITPVGRFLRRLRLDELPQLFNILCGDMSVVGPRPERPELAQEYEKEMPEFCFRLKVKAGLTGYAQVLGKYNTTPYDKLKLDLMYIENYSLFLDLKLILMTLKILFLSESTEGAPPKAEDLPRRALDGPEK